MPFILQFFIMLRSKLNEKVPNHSCASLVAQTVKNLLAMWDTQVWSLGWEDPLVKGMATHSSILDGRIPWTEEPGRLHTVHGIAESDMAEWLTLSLTSVHFLEWDLSIGEELCRKVEVLEIQHYLGLWRLLKCLRRLLS